MTREECEKLSHYQQLLNQHDWYYMMSDDHRVYKKGEQAQQRIDRLAAQNPELMTLLENHKQKVYS